MTCPKPSSSAPGTQSAAVSLDLPEGSLELQVPVPLGPERVIDFALKTLPLSDVVADMACQEAQRLGFPLSCTKGCGACCRQLVPLSPPEAGLIFEVVQSMPKPRRVQVEARFHEAVEQLDKDGLLNTIKEVTWALGTDEDAQTLARQYFSRSIPCPFLEDEACTIYELRPSMCREYLVTSPAELCRTPYEAQVMRLPLSIRLSEALARTWSRFSGRQVQVIPSILALEWTEQNPDIRVLTAPGRELLIDFIGHVSELAQRRSSGISPAPSPSPLHPLQGDPKP